MKSKGSGNFLSGGVQSVTDGQRGWFVGHFIDPQLALRQSRDLEIKWGLHKAGEARAGWALNRKATTLSILISGEFHLAFAEETIELKKAGDYVIWGPEVAHCWKAISETTILTVRWPSLENDSENVAPLRQLDF